MKSSKFNETQIIAILKQQESGMSVNDICREHGISQPTFYSWKGKLPHFDKISDSFFFESLNFILDIRIYYKSLFHIFYK